MHRRSFLALTIAACALPGVAFAQTQTPAQAQRTPPPPITPQNELERAFLAALGDPELRPAFRRELLSSQVALAMANTAADSPPREIQVGPELRTGAIFTSTARLNSVLGPTSPRRVMTGRAALELLRGKNVVLNMMLSPMLTLEPEDVAEYLGG